MYSIGRPTSKINELMWFFNVGLDGKNGKLHKKWVVKTFDTVLKENNHVDVISLITIIRCINIRVIQMAHAFDSPPTQVTFFFIS